MLTNCIRAPRCKLPSRLKSDLIIKPNTPPLSVSQDMTYKLTLAENAVKFCEDIFPLGAYNKPEDVAHAEGNKGICRDHLGTELLKLRRNAHWRKVFGLYSDLWHHRAMQRAKVGNCAEQARAAFNYLSSAHSQLNSEKVGLATAYFKNIDHVFVLIGVSNKLKIGKSYSIKDLGTGIVVCDPWFHEWFSLDSADNKLKSIGRMIQSYNYEAGHTGYKEPRSFTIVIESFCQREHKNHEVFFIEETIGTNEKIQKVSKHLQASRP